MEQSETHSKYDPEHELALTRESIAEMDAGIPCMTIDEAMAALDEELHRLTADFAPHRKE